MITVIQVLFIQDVIFVWFYMSNKRSSKCHGIHVVGYANRLLAKMKRKNGGTIANFYISFNYIHNIYIF